ncbi:uncharacterized protein METZ01_LOCUS59419, partial [marine metagenome]
VDGNHAVTTVRTAASYYKANPLSGGILIRTMRIGLRLLTARGLRFQRSPHVALNGAKVMLGSTFVGLRCSSVWQYPRVSLFA